ncbi:MAG: CvpA family protein [Rhodospirillales bacterium]|nr:CvpA family protein [Rhodospirillales bacterium]
MVLPNYEAYLIQKGPDISMIVDILVLVVLLISGLVAFLRGFIREVLTIAGVVGGLAAAYLGGPLLMPYMRGWFGIEDGVEPERLLGLLPYDIVANALSYGVIFIVVVIILSIQSHLLAEWAKKIGLGPVDRSMGFVFGLARGIILLGLLYLPVHFFVDEESKDSYFSESKTHFYLEKTSEIIAGFIPSGAFEEAREKVEGLEEASETRKKLEEINLLKSDGEKGDASAQDGRESGAEGYSEDFREKMDQLFDEKNQDLNE